MPQSISIHLHTGTIAWIQIHREKSYTLSTSTYYFVMESQDLFYAGLTDSRLHSMQKQGKKGYFRARKSSTPLSICWRWYSPAKGDFLLMMLPLAGGVLENRPSTCMHIYPFLLPNSVFTLRSIVYTVCTHTCMLTHKWQYNQHLCMPLTSPPPKNNPNTPFFLQPSPRSTLPNLPSSFHPTIPTSQAPPPLYFSCQSSKMCGECCVLALPIGSLIIGTFT